MDDDLFKKALLQYAGQDVFDRVLRDGHNALSPWHELFDAVVYAQDISGFASIPSLTPDVILGLLNNYLNLTARAIVAQGGRIVSFFGNGSVLAYWPLTTEAQTNACAASLAVIQESRKGRDALFQGLHINPIIGLSSGKVMLAATGGNTHTNLQLLGPFTNQAQRLSSLNPSYGTSIIISKAITEKLTGQHLVRQLDTIRVRGLSAPEEIFQLLS